MMTYPLVNNKFPTAQFNKIAIIGEAPGRYEVEIGEPFVGPSSRFLRGLLSRAGINPLACFFGNVCQYQPPANEISRFSWGGEEIQESLLKLKEEIVLLQPNIILLLGNIPLKAAMDPSLPHPLLPGRFKYSISDWRGSILLPSSESIFCGIKCLPSYHPAAVLRQYDWCPVLTFDLRRLSRESSTASVIYPIRDAQINLDPYSLISQMSDMRVRKQPIAIDIEGGVDSMSCISIAPSHDRAILIPFANLDGSNHWTHEDDEFILWRALADLLYDPEVPKILQNSLYDRFVLQYSYGIPVRGVVDDTMLKHWELYCELEKSLAFQTSIYTQEPYYKFERKQGDRNTFYRYCCKDSMVTFEINQLLETKLSPASRKHYQFNLDLLNPLLYMELRGIKYDHDKAKTRRLMLEETMFARQHELNELTGNSLASHSPLQIHAIITSLMCYKKDPEHVKTPYLNTYIDATRLAALPNKLPSQ